ncbi:MAG: cytochrome c-type biogenesis protein [Actinomycetota bacterium]
MTRAGCVALMLVAMLAAPATAQSPEDLANEISNKVMSPYCPGVTLHDCPSQEALDLRDDIAGYAARGMSEDEIMDRLEADFGPSIRAEPSSDGAGVLAWVLPTVALLVGGAAAWTLVRHWTGARVRAEPDHRKTDARPLSPASAEERQRLSAELGRLRKRA